jgi:hypothetical protein
MAISNGGAKHVHFTFVPTLSLSLLLLVPLRLRRLICSSLVVTCVSWKSCALVLSQRQIWHRAMPRASATGLEDTMVEKVHM